MTRQPPDSIRQIVEEEVLQKSKAVSSHLSMYDVRLTSLRASLGQLTDEFPALSRLTRKHGAIRDDANSQLRVDAIFQFDLAYDTDESKENPPVSICATFSLSYDMPDLGSFDDEHLDAFAEANGVYNAWPFWRELVHSVLGRMGLPAVSLPLYRVIDRDE